MEIMAYDSLPFLLQWGIRFYNYVFTCVCYSPLTNFLNFFLAKWKLWRMRMRLMSNVKGVATCPLGKLSDGCICMEEMKIVMDRLGIACQEDDYENWNFGVSEFSEMLLDEEPSLLEIKQVFEVFDENKDGVIDASELQRVLCGLCLKEGSDLEECRKMVCAFDQNGDGLLDYQEFVAFMEKCLY